MEGKDGLILSCIFKVPCVFNVVWGVVCVNRLIGNEARFGRLKQQLKHIFSLPGSVLPALFRVFLVLSFIHNYKLSLLLFRS